MAGDSLSVGLLDQLYGRVDSQLLEVLRQIIGNCQQLQSSRGQVEFPGVTIKKDGTIIFGGDQVSHYHNKRETTIRKEETVITGIIRWAVAQAKPRQENDEWWVSCQGCDNAKQDNLAQVFDVLCVPTGGNDPDIDSGDLVTYTWMPYDRGSSVRVWMNNYQTSATGSS